MLRLWDKKFSSLQRKRLISSCVMCLKGTNGRKRKRWTKLCHGRERRLSLCFILIRWRLRFRLDNGRGAFPSLPRFFVSSFLVERPFRRLTRESVTSTMRHTRLVWCWTSVNHLFTRGVANNDARSMNRRINRIHLDITVSKHANYFQTIIRMGWTVSVFFFFFFSFALENSSIWVKGWKKRLFAKDSLPRTRKV